MTVFILFTGAFEPGKIPYASVGKFFVQFFFVHDFSSSVLVILRKFDNVYCIGPESSSVECSLLHRLHIHRSWPLSLT